MKKCILVVFAISIVIGAAYFATIVHAQTRAAVAGRPGEGYQAVFLTNGQVYFGKLADPSTAFVSLTDIFYLRTHDALQQDGAKDPASVSLVKLGSELHAPLDEMMINRDHILYWENLKENGSVVRAIRQYQANGGK